eukprot:383996-Pleurochrysis_carterae.AAC.3
MTKAGAGRVNTVADSRDVWDCAPQSRIQRTQLNSSASRVTRSSTNVVAGAAHHERLVVTARRDPTARPRIRKCEPVLRWASNKSRRFYRKK